MKRFETVLDVYLRASRRNVLETPRIVDKLQDDIIIDLRQISF